MDVFIRVFLRTVSFVVLAHFSQTAHAEIYKYTDAKGTIVYTDKLDDLPVKRKKYYQKKIAQRKELESQAEYQAKQQIEELEKRRAELANIQAEQERHQKIQQNVAKLQKAIRTLEVEQQRRELQKIYWKERITRAQRRLAETLDSYRETKKKYEALAIKADFALFPGQLQEKYKLLENLRIEEQAVDAANIYLTETIPQEAHKQGVPPGWLR